MANSIGPKAGSIALAVSKAGVSTALKPPREIVGLLITAKY